MNSNWPTTFSLDIGEIQRETRELDGQEQQDSSGTKLIFRGNPAAGALVDGELKDIIPVRNAGCGIWFVQHTAAAPSHTEIGSFPKASERGRPELSQGGLCAT
jgi:hypothetical protein